MSLFDTVFREYSSSGKVMTVAEANDAEPALLKRGLTSYRLNHYGCRISTIYLMKNKTTFFGPKYAILYDSGRNMGFVAMASSATVQDELFAAVHLEMMKMNERLVFFLQSNLFFFNRFTF